MNIGNGGGEVYEMRAMGPGVGVGVGRPEPAPDESVPDVPAPGEPAPGVPRSFYKKYIRPVSRFIRSINDRINGSLIGRFFRLRGSGHEDEIADADFLTEIRAGLTTFATMAYIIAVNAAILADTGYDCVCEQPEDQMGNCANQDDYSKCYNEIKLDLITATAAISGFSSIMFGLLTNLPVALAPGMGLNAYFTYQVVGVHGRGEMPYQIALTAVFYEGWVFVVLALTGLRHWLVRIIPGTIKTASGVGIGLYLTLIGMSYSSGIGLVTGATSTPLAIGGCAKEDLSPSGMCERNIMGNPKMWIGIVCGGIFTSFLMSYRVKSAIVIGIALVSALSWPRNTAVTYFPDTLDGNERWDYFKQVVSFHPIQRTLFKQQWDLTGYGGRFALAMLTFLYVDIIDCTATLYSMARFSNKVQHNRRDFPRSTLAYCVDAVSISVGALVGVSPVTAFVESGAGIAEGGRTGLTAIVCGFCFLLSLFFAPIFASIPPWATGCTLILVGCLMVRQVTKINWAYIGDVIPSFVTMTLIPFSYSVAYGLIGGLFTYAGLNTLIWIVMKLSGDAIVPTEYELKEYWTWKPAGKKPWIIRVFTKNRFWDDNRELKRSPGFSLGSDSSIHNRSPPVPPDHSDQPDNPDITPPPRYPAPPDYPAPPAPPAHTASPVAPAPPLRPAAPDGNSQSRELGASYWRAPLG